MSRKCGACDVCCTVLEIVELKKPKSEPCPNMTGCGTKRCGIYSSRPSECETWKCLWLEGHGSSDARPDRSGLMFMTSESSFGSAILVHVLKSGADKKPVGVKAMDKMRRLANANQRNLLVRHLECQVKTEIKMM